MLTSIGLTDRDYFDLFFVSDKKNQKIQKDQKPIYVDVGSFNGDTIDIALKYNSNLKIVAIEPIKQLCESMKQRFANNNNITIVNKAAWNNKCNTEFSEYEGWAKGLSTLQPIMTQLRPVPYFAQNISKYNIECDTLDNILSEYNIQSIDYLKIDTEGSEEDVLSGFTKYKNGTIFHIEFHIINLANILQRLLEMNAKIDRVALHRDANINNHVVGIVIGEFTDNPQTDTVKDAIKEATKSTIVNTVQIIGSKETDKEIKTITWIDRRNWILQHCKFGEKILDIGSTDGWIFRDSHLVPYVTSIDLDRYDLPNFYQMDAHDLKFNDKSFDIAVLGEVVEHVNDPIQVLKEAKRVAKRIIMTVPDEEHWAKQWFPYETTEEMTNRRGMTLEQIAKVSSPNAKEFYNDNYKHLFHNRHYSEDTLRQDLDKAGITNYEMNRLQYDGWSFFVVETIATQLDSIGQTIYDTFSSLDHSYDTKAQKGPIITKGPIATTSMVIKDRLNIALISTPFFAVPPEKYGGLEQIVWDLAYGLDGLGHKVTIFGPEGSKSTDHGFVVHTGPSINTVGVSWLEEERKVYDKYKDIITPDKFDIVHGHDWFGFEYILKMNNSKLKVIHTHHGGLNWETPPPFPKPNLVAISDFMRQYSIQYFGQKGYNVQCKHVHNGIDLDKYPFNPNTKKTDRLLYVGRFSKFKQPHIAIRVAKRANLPIDLIGGTFVDDINYLKEIESMCDGNNVAIYKDTDHNFKIKKMQEAKCLIVPSKMGEPFGLTCTEGMACGTPVIATRDGAIPEIVVDGRTGFICDTEEQMVKVIKNIDKIDPLKCRKHVEDNFGRLRMAENYARLYQRILNNDEW